MSVQSTSLSRAGYGALQTRSLEPDDGPLRHRPAELKWGPFFVCRAALLPVTIVLVVVVFALVAMSCLVISCLPRRSGGAALDALARKGSWLVLALMGVRVVLEEPSSADVLASLPSPDPAMALPQPFVVVSNHLSYIDHWVLFSTLGPLAPIVRADCFQTPLIGRILKTLGALGVDRRRRGGGAAGAGESSTSDQMRQRLAAGAWPPVLVFAEGTTSNGSGILEFRTGAFVAAAPVLAVSLRYASPSGFDLCWTDQASTPRHAMRMLCEPSKVALIALAPLHHPTKAEAAVPSEYAAAVRRTMAKNLPQPPEGLTGRTTRTLWDGWDYAKVRAFWAAENENYERQNAS